MAHDDCPAAERQRDIQHTCVASIKCMYKRLPLLACGLARSISPPWIVVMSGRSSLKACLFPLGGTYWNVLLVSIRTCKHRAFQQTCVPSKAQTPAVDRLAPAWRLEMNIRPATSADVPAVARLVLAALADEAPWNSFCPSKALTGGSGCIEFAEAMLRSHLDSQRHRVMVLELSAPKSGTRSGPPIVVSVAVWDTDACRSATERDGPAGRLHENGEVPAQHTPYRLAYWRQRLPFSLCQDAR